VDRGQGSGHRGLGDMACTHGKRAERGLSHQKDSSKKLHVVDETKIHKTAVVCLRPMSV
jgi:hypothetical protein